ncbi:MAG TPA: sodium-dependent transporter [Burkholderiaceae bacterium]|jgi:NSS family neurotransmitter:Na+ symporter|nr:sodium-dependent transporter [Burkholderiaceae bacterium]
MTTSAQRDGFTSTLGVLAATLGSAVGLGNIWKFPALTGANGGAGFLLVYLFATLLVGLPVMIAEITLGRRARANPIAALKGMAPGRPWWLVGVSGMVAAFMIMAFYSEVVAWVFAYVWKSLEGSALSSDAAVTEGAFAALVASPWQSLIWQWVVLLLIGGILLRGVARGIEAVTKRLMPLLFLLLAALCVFSLTLDGAREGLAFLFSPDFSRVNAGVVLTAVGLAFFKMSIGMGTMMTYGSYFRADQNIPQTAARVMCADLAVSLLAGIAIFPAVFTFGFEPTAGPSLVFITLPAVFAQLPFGQGLMFVFFVLTSIAAIGAMLSLLEVPVLVLHERLGMKRSNAIAVCVLIVGVLGAGCALSMNLLADWRVQGRNLFDLMDFLSSNVLLPLGGILIALFTGWVWGRDAFSRAVSNEGSLDNRRLAGGLVLILRYVSPLLIFIVMLNGLGFI